MARDLAHCNESYDLSGTETALLAACGRSKPSRITMYSAHDGNIRNITMNYNQEKVIVLDLAQSQSCC